MPLEDSPQLPWAPVQLVSVSWAESLQKLYGYLGHHDLSSSSPSATTSPFCPSLAWHSPSGQVRAHPAHPLVQGRASGGQRTLRCQDGLPFGGPSSRERACGCRHLSLTSGQSQGR